MRSVLCEYLNDFWIRIFLGSALFLNLGLALFVYFFIKAQSLIALHYNVLWGVDYFAKPIAIFQFPIVGVATVLFNGFLGYKLWVNHRPISLFLNLASVFIAVVLVVVGFSLYLINS